MAPLCKFYYIFGVCIHVTLIEYLINCQNKFMLDLVHILLHAFLYELFFMYFLKSSGESEV